MWKSYLSQASAALRRTTPSDNDRTGHSRGNRDGRMTPSVAMGLRELGVTVICPASGAACAHLLLQEVHSNSPAAHVCARGRHRPRSRLDNTIRKLCATFGIRLDIFQRERFHRLYAGGSFRPERW